VTEGKAGGRTPEGHTLSRFDGDLGQFRSIVLDMGRLVQTQVDQAATAVGDCDIASAQQVVAGYSKVRNLDIEALEANARLYAIHQPVARDLRYVLTLSRAVYDLERISGEAVRLADIARHLYEMQLNRRSCVIFEDVRRIHGPVAGLLQRSLQAIADEDARVAREVALDGEDVEGMFRAAVRRLATYVMEDQRNIGLVIDATLAVKSMERIGDHACSIARNVVYSVTGKDVRHVHTASFDLD
jgi:phosphate transport system protein